MTVIDPGHEYEAANLGGGSQVIKFIKKQPKEGGEEGELETVHDGTTTEAVIEIVIHRLKTLNERLQDDHTVQAVEHLAAAYAALERRNADRAARGVKGTNKA